MKLFYLAVFAIFLAGCASVQVETTRNTARSIYIQGLLYEVDGDLDNALLQYTRSLEKNPQNSFIYGKIGKILLREKKYAEAEKIFLKAISIDKEEPGNYLNLGLTYYYTKSYEKAISYIEKGLKIKEFPSYRMILCDLYASIGKYEKAFESYAILIKEYPSNFLLYYNAGLLLVKLNREKEAEQYFLNAIKFQPVFFKSYLELGSLYEKQNRIEDAIQYYGRAMEISPEDPSGYERMIELYIKQGNWKEAENLLTKAIKKNLQSSMINQILGSISFENKKYFDAEIYYKRALMIKEEPSLWFNLGIIYDRMGNKKEMEKCMRRVIELDKNHHLALNYLGYSFLLEDKNIDEALKMIQKAVKLDPDNGAYLDSLGWAYYKKGNYKMAEKFLNMAKEKETDPEIFEHLGYLYYKKNDNIRAIYWWARAQEISPKKEISQMIEKAKLSIHKK
ncbi:MAG: tetratricopeptide repeat protein [Candidatus Omnitrophica bacterium]|nr:tetratricopeptide repeat protein [Candidatus Omnitrophota bacterium]MCM8827937.1 tetratricopeptide repeat protein [Candidatus Omnitrophota bacterium]